MLQKTLKSFKNTFKVIQKPLKNDFNPKTITIFRRIFGGIYHHYVFKRSWDKISKSNGQWILFDQIHLNERGAKVVFKKVKEFISSD